MTETKQGTADFTIFYLFIYFFKKGLDWMMKKWKNKKKKKKKKKKEKKKKKRKKKKKKKKKRKKREDIEL